LYDNAKHGYPDELPEDPRQHGIFWLREIVGRDEVTELFIKVGDPPGGGRPITRAGWFNYGRLGSLFIEGMRYSPHVVGVYHSLNPVDPEAHPGTDRLTAPGRRRSNKNQITSRRLLLIDVDSERPAGQPATDGEKQQAWQVLKATIAGLHKDGWPEPAIIDSGNGYYAVYRIDLPADPNDDIIKRVLKGLAARFDTDGAKIDTKTHDPARLMRLPGTMNRKGPEDPDAGRVHRLCQIIEYPMHGLVTVGAQQLEAAAAPKESSPSVAIEPLSFGSDEPLSDQQAIKMARKYVAKMPAAVSGQGGHDRTYAVVCKLVIGFDLTIEQAMPILRKYNERCMPPWSEAELRHKLQDANAITDQTRGLLRVGQHEYPDDRYLGYDALPGPTFVGYIPDFSYVDGNTPMAPVDTYENRPWHFWIDFYLVWAMKRANYQVPETLLRQCWYGGQYTTNWRKNFAQDVVAGKSLHHGPCIDGRCIYYGNKDRHRHYLAEVLQWGVLEHFSVSPQNGNVINNDQGLNLNRQFDLNHPDRKELKDELFRTGRIRPIYWPALLFGRSPKIGWDARTVRTLVGIVRELTRNAGGDKHSAITGQVIKGNRVAGAGASTVVCPYLSPNEQYVVFGGNGKASLRGRGYRLVGRNQKGWFYRMTGHSLPPASDPNHWNHVVRALKAVKRLAADLDLVVVGYYPKHHTVKWRSLDEMVQLACKPTHRQWLEQCTIRIYAPADWLVRWRYFFSRRLGFNWIPSSPDDEGPTPIRSLEKSVEVRDRIQLRKWMSDQDITQINLAEMLTQFSGKTVTRQRIGNHMKGDSSNNAFWKLINDFINSKRSG